jgi:hypothetical protein
VCEHSLIFSRVRSAFSLHRGERATFAPCGSAWCAPIGAPAQVAVSVVACGRILGCRAEALLLCAS